MGIKMEKRFGRQELADFLTDLSKQVQGGQVKGETRSWTIPEQVEGTIHFKEEEGEVVAKIKLWWPAAAGRQAVPEEGDPQARLHLKEVKARLSTSFKELQKLIMQGIIPDSKTLHDFVAYSRAFAAFVKPEWQEQMAEYMTHVENLQGVVAGQQLEAMQEELQILVDRMIVCHRQFKK